MQEAILALSLAAGSTFTSGIDPARSIDPRDAARTVLEDALVEARDHRGGDARALQTLLRGAREASERFVGSRLAEVLADRARDARWIGVINETEARERLEEELGRIVADLAFVRRDEAELPRDFPAPTPVGQIEVKEIPRYRMAQAPMANGRSSAPFWKLFLHIKKHDIAMTAPVETSFTHEAGELRETDMAFLYGRPEVGTAGPDAAVEVRDVAATRVVSLGCRGLQTLATVEAARDELTRWIARRGQYEIDGEVRTMSYNSPMIPARERFYEVQIPVRAAAPANGSAGQGSLPAETSRRRVIDFSAPDTADQWRAIGDVVMGGVSSSRFEASDEGTALFTGDVSLENNGGFASVRSRSGVWDLDDARALVLRFRGDGKTYKFRLQTSRAYDGVNYQSIIRTEAGEWSERTFTAADFLPVWRGRLVPNAPALDLAEVQSFGFLISDEQEGGFRLEVAAIEKKS